MSKDIYIKEALRQLSDPTTYRRLDYDPTSEFSTEIESLISDLCSQGIRSEDVCKFALSLQSKPARFYL